MEAEQSTAANTSRKPIVHAGDRATSLLYTVPLPPRDLARTEGGVATMIGSPAALLVHYRVIDLDQNQNILT